MSVRLATVAAAVLVAGPALAEPLDVAAAHRFVVGKTFAYNCFDGTRGAGRIQSDLSVAGTIQIKGTGPVRFVTAAARNAEGQRRRSLRLRARHPVRALLQCQSDRCAEFPRLDFGPELRLLRFHPPQPAHADGAHHLASADAVAAARHPRRSSGARRRLTINRGIPESFAACRLPPRRSRRRRARARWCAGRDA